MTQLLSGFREARDEMISKFDTEWKADRSEKVFYDNQDRDPPDDANYIHVSIQGDDATPVAISGSKQRYRQVGRVVVSAYTLKGEFTGTNDDLLDTAADILRGLNQNGVQFRAPNPPIRVGVVGTHYQQNQSTEYYWELEQ